MADKELNAVVIQKVEVSPGLMVLRVQPDGWDLPDFIPGQFATLGLPGKAPRCQLSDPEEKTGDPDKIIKRAYSIASSSRLKEYIEFFITLVRSGQLTPRLFELEVGSRLLMGQKFKGVFTIDLAPEDKNIVMIATGTGLAPYMSVIRTCLNMKGNRRFAILHGARHSWDLGYRSELITLSGLSENFEYVPSISRPDEEHLPWGGRTGYVQDLWKVGLVEKAWGFKPTPENTHVFLCGSPDMVEDAVSILGAEGYKEHKKKDPGQVYVERWW